MIVTLEEEKKWIYSILESLGASSEEATISSNVLSEGDLRGYSSHGIMRLKYIVSGVKSGTLKIPSDPKFKIIRENIGHMDGDHGLGHFVTTKATKEAINMCDKYGIALIGINNSNHYGMAGIYAEAITEKDMIGIILSSSDPVVHAIGGIDRVMGTNSLSIGIPGKDGPVLLDMATSEASRGKILEARRRGKKIPENWAISSDGKITDDPATALSGALNPFGGIKGFGISLIISIMAGAFVGAEMGSNVRGTLDLKETCTKGDLMIAIDPYIFEDKQTFSNKVETFISEIKNSRKIPGVDEIVIPGERSRKKRADGLKKGYEIDESTLNELRNLLASFSIECPFMV
ncbi:MAG: Ldh family oxidoreductase [Thermoplasmataceae archaeon]